MIELHRGVRAASLAWPVVDSALARSVRRLALFLGVGLVFGAVGCSGSLDANLEGRRCSSHGQCLPGYRCTAENICISADSSRLGAKGERERDASVSPVSESDGGDEDAAAQSGASDSGMTVGAAGATSGTGGASGGDAPAGAGGNGDSRGAGDACSTGSRSRCNNSCVDLANDPMHCGGCDKVCTVPKFGSALCVSGQCGFSCASGSTACGSECVDLASDERHCGGCDSACPAGVTCNGGSCGGSVCEDGLKSCGTRCVDTARDLENCGECGRKCEADEGTAECNAGHCSVQCPSGRSSCDGACVDIQSDRQNCGACGETCPSSESCRAGSCHGEGLDVDAARALFLKHGVDLDQLARRADVDLDDFEGRHVTVDDLSRVGLNRQRLRQLGITDEELESVGIDTSNGTSNGGRGRP